MKPFLLFTFIIVCASLEGYSQIINTNYLQRKISQAQAEHRAKQKKNVENDAKIKADADAQTQRRIQANEFGAQYLEQNVSADNYRKGPQSTYLQGHNYRAFTNYALGQGIKKVIYGTGAHKPNEVIYYNDGNRINTEIPALLTPEQITNEQLETEYGQSSNKGRVNSTGTQRATSQSKYIIPTTSPTPSEHSQAELIEDHNPSGQAPKNNSSHQAFTPPTKLIREDSEDLSILIQTLSENLPRDISKEIIKGNDDAFARGLCAKKLGQMALANEKGIPYQCILKPGNATVKVNEYKKEK